MFSHGFKDFVSQVIGKEDRARLTVLPTATKEELDRLAIISFVLHNQANEADMSFRIALQKAGIEEDKLQFVDHG